MATIIVEDKQFEAPDGKRLVLALVDENIDILHRCGGNARCTTCRVTFNSGEPATYHPNEKAKLEAKGAVGEYRLSCHILCTGTMDINVLNTLAASGLPDPGSRPADEIPG